MWGKSGRTIRDWRSKFITNAGEFPDSMRGRYARDSIIDHEDCHVKAAKWVRLNSCVRGKPNMTVVDFARYLNDDLLPSLVLPPHFPTSVSVPTAGRFLHSLGFSKVSANRKSVYLDGHERFAKMLHLLLTKMLTFILLQT